MPDENSCTPVITAPTLTVVGQLRLGWRGREWKNAEKEQGGFGLFFCFVFLFLKEMKRLYFSLLFRNTLATLFLLLVLFLKKWDNL